MDKKHAIQYAVTVALNHEEIGKNPKRITKIKPFKNKYKWEEINFPSKKDDWNIKFEKIDVMIAFNVFMLNKYILLMFQNINQIVKNKFF